MSRRRLPRAATGGGVWARSSAMLTCALALALAAGCREQSPVGTAPAPRVIEIKEGEAALRVSIDHEQLTTAERLTVTVEASGARGSRVNVPLDESEFKGWTVVDRWRSELVVEPTGRSGRHARVVLEPFLAGDYTVPSISATTVSRAGVHTTQTIRSPAFQVTVRSLLPGGSPIDQVPDIMEYTPPVAGSGRSRTLVLIGAVAGAVVVAAIAATAAVRRRRATSGSGIDLGAVRALVLRRAVERGEFSEVTPDLLAAVLADHGASAGSGGEESEVAALSARLDTWRFGGVGAHREAIADAARTAVRWLDHRPKNPGTEAAA